MQTSFPPANILHFTRKAFNVESSKRSPLSPGRPIWFVPLLTRACRTFRRKCEIPPKTGPACFTTSCWNPPQRKMGFWILGTWKRMKYMGFPQLPVLLIEFTICLVGLQEIASTVTIYTHLFENDVILNSFVSNETAELWIDCCHNAANCCKTMLSNTTEPGMYRLYIPPRSKSKK